MHVTTSNTFLGAYDMIIGRDIMCVRFSSMEIEWDHRTMPFKKHDATVYDSYHIDKPASVDEHAERVKKILDVKYKAADLEQVCSAQTHLQAEQQ